MHMPRGLQKPHHIAEIIPPLLAFATVAWATIAAIAHVVQTTAQ
jgi:hypothetical protein